MTNPNTQAVAAPSHVLVPAELLKEAIESIDDYRAGVEFGSYDRKLLGKLKAALAASPPVQQEPRQQLEEALELACEELAGYMNLPIENDPDWIEQEAGAIALMDKLRAALGKPSWLKACGITRTPSEAKGG